MRDLEHVSGRDCARSVLALVVFGLDYAIAGQVACIGPPCCTAGCLSKSMMCM